MADDTGAASRPLASILLIAFRQQSTVAAAIEGALAQTYHPLEILISDDASDDGTWDAIERAVAGYGGPHRLRLWRNPANLGIGAHISLLASRAQGEMLFVAAGDDVSLPQRCERVMAAWRAHEHRPELIASALIDVDAEGRAHGTVHPTQLSTYGNAADWLANPPFVVGAAQAWTRRLFERFGPLASGVVAEDMVMAFRAIVASGAGGAITIDDALVRYRRGGVSRRVRNLHASDVIRRLRKSSAAALVELPQLLADAQAMGQLAMVEPALQRQLARARFVCALFEAPSPRSKLRVLRDASDVPISVRCRLGIYAMCPGLLAPLFFLKRLRYRRSAGA